MFHWIVIFYWLLVVSFSILMTLLFVFIYSRTWASLTWEPAGFFPVLGSENWAANRRLRWRASSDRHPSPWILNECNLSCNRLSKKEQNKSVRGLFKKKKTSPHIVLCTSCVPQMWCIKSIKGWFTQHQICLQDFVKYLTCRTQKNPALFCFYLGPPFDKEMEPRNCNM